MKTPAQMFWKGSISAFVAMSVCLVFFGSGCAEFPSTESGSILPVETTPLPIKGERAKLTLLGPNSFEVKCDKIEVVTAKQRETNWCWAACAAMIFRYNGQAIPQEEIVRAIDKQAKTGEDSEQADQYEIWLAMNPDLVQEMARRKAAWENVGKPNTVHIVGPNMVNMNNVINSMTDPSTDALVQEISSGNPAVMGLHGGRWGDGHVVLVYGVDYSRSHPKGDVEYKDMSMLFYRFSHRFIIQKLMVIDPYPIEGQSPYIEISADELQTSLDFTVGKSDARKQFEAYMKVYMPTPDEIRNPNN